jgi:TonB-linked SusC/RagA family outer membrane protein
MKFLKLLFTFIFFAIAGVTSAGFSLPASPDSGNMEPVQQKIIVTGTVSDELDVLLGASVTVKGTTQGVITDIDGNFSIVVPSKESVLVFSYMGYSPQEMVVGDRRIIYITLIENVNTIEEVVVVGYGVQRKATMVGAVAQVKGNELLSAGSVTSVSQAIQGMMPGVVVDVNTGLPGRDAGNIYIRGMGTWQGNKQPLCLVDGVERDFNDIDPNEIETISVLKDAAATAVYGVKGGNGVIIVSTKRGTNQRPTVNASANFGFKHPLSSPKYADYVTSMEMWNEAVHNDKQWEYLIPESTIAAWKNAYATGNYGPYNDYFPEVNWWDEMIQWGHQQQFNLSIRGGTQFVKYFVSFAYLNDGDIYRVEKSDMFDNSYYYKRYNWRTNLDFNVSKSTVFSVNSSGVQGNRNQAGFRGPDNNPDQNDGQSQRFYKELYRAERNMFPIRWSDTGTEADGQFGSSASGAGNLKTYFMRGQRMFKNYQNFIDLGLKQDLDFVTKGLSANIKFSYTSGSETHSRIQLHQGEFFGAGGNSEGNSIIRYYRKYDYSKPLDGGGYSLADASRFPDAEFQGERHQVVYDAQSNGGYSRRMKYEGSLNYARSFGKHNVSALSVLERYENEGLNAGNVNNMRFREREEAWITRETYDYEGRYLFEFAGSYTGSMRFKRGLRFKFFPSYSLGWRISEEPFIKNNAISNKLSNLKLRYTYGTVGYDRNADFFTYIQTFNVGGPNTGMQLGAGEAYNTNYGPMITEGKIANERATWETAYKQNLGLDWGLFNNKLTGTVDLYKERREGILMTMIAPAWFGFKDPDANLGITKNHGIEVELGWNSKIGDDFRYFIKGNLALNENRIVDRNDAPGTAEYRKWAGKPIGYSANILVAGYYESLDDIYNSASSSAKNNIIPGDFMYMDYNANGVITNSADQDQAPMKELSIPLNTYGWTVGFSWKNFDFSMMWYGVQGVYKNLVNEMLLQLTDGINSNYYAFPEVVNRWTPETAAYSVMPSLHTSSTYRAWNESGSTWKWRDASYLRLKNLEVSYSINKKLAGKLRMTKCQFYANGNNLLTFTKFNKYMDPENNSADTYPMIKRYNLGIRIGF